LAINYAAFGLKLLKL